MRSGFVLVVLFPAIFIEGYLLPLVGDVYFDKLHGLSYYDFDLGAYYHYDHVVYGFSRRERRQQVPAHLCGVGAGYRVVGLRVCSLLVATSLPAASTG